MEAGEEAATFPAETPTDTDQYRATDMLGAIIITCSVSAEAGN